jgi:hypothetical protein
VDIRGVASQPPSPIAPAGEVHARFRAAPQSADSIGALLGKLATPSVQNLLSATEPHRSHGTPEITDGLLRAAADAIAAHDIPRALRALSELVKANPESADLLLREPSPQPVQGDVRALLQQLGHSARISAETVLTGASQLVEIGNPLNVLPGGLYAADVLALANRFYEAGQLANYMRAEALGRLVIDSYEAPAALGGKVADRLKMLWRRAPMLSLLVTWLFVGVVGGLAAWTLRKSGTAPSGLAFDLWGIGFLALVALQFFATVYNRNSGKLK